MKTWMKWTSLAAFGLLASTAFAADHGDSTETAGNADADITDVYSWVKSDNASIVLMMNITGDFSDAVQYAFHVGRAADAGTAATDPTAGFTDVICEFDAAGMIQCWAGADNYVAGDASANAGIGDDTFRVHAGQHADPFFFYLDGFGAAIDAAVAADGALMGGIASLADNAGCPDLSDPVTAVVPTSGCNPGSESVGIMLAGLLTGAYDPTDNLNCVDDPNGDPNFYSVNNFETNNVNSIVIELDASLIGGTGNFLQVWGSTHAKAGS